MWCSSLSLELLEYFLVSLGKSEEAKEQHKSNGHIRLQLMCPNYILGYLVGTDNDHWRMDAGKQAGHFFIFCVGHFLLAFYLLEQPRTTPTYAKQASLVTMGRRNVSRGT